MHYTEIVAGDLVTDLTPSTLALLLAAARTAGEVAIVIGTHSGRVSSVHASPITRTIAPTGFVACGGSSSFRVEIRFLAPT